MNITISAHTWLDTGYISAAFILIPMYNLEYYHGVGWVSEITCYLFLGRRTGLTVLVLRFLDQARFKSVAKPRQRNSDYG